MTPEKHRALFRKLAETCWHGGDLDGGTLQEWLTEAGVLVPVRMEKPCGENFCACAEAGAIFPEDCYRLAPELN